MGVDEGGLLISLDGVMPTRIVSVCLSLSSLAPIKSRRSFLLALAHLYGPGKMAVKWLWCGCGGMFL